MRLIPNLLRATAFLGARREVSFPDSCLIVDRAPNTPQPYVLPNLNGAAVDFGGLIIRTLVSNTTSAGTMSLLSVNSGESGLNLIHSHREVEAFYTLKGSVQVFHNSEQGRELRANDFALLAPGNNHTYRPNDLDFQLTLCMAPGGIDDFFAAAGESYDSRSPFDPQNQPKLDVPKVARLMPKYNIIPAPNNIINMDWTNGTTEDGLGTWRVECQSLPEASNAPYFISSNRGPKYLHRETGQVVAQLAVGKQTKNKLSVATIALKPCDKPNASPSFPVDQAFQVTEGQLFLEMKEEIVPLVFGDVAFIPRNTIFRYWSIVGFTKFIVWSAGSGLAERLIERADPWAYAVWPA